MAVNPQVKIPEKLVPVFSGNYRYRGSHGGRGSAKTRTFAKMSAVRGLQLAENGEEGLIVCGREYMNSLDDSSLAEVKAAIASEPFLRDYYDVGEKYIRTRNRRIDFAFIGLRQNLESIKSKARVHLIWVDEAEAVSESAWRIVTPTVREQNSEIWASWNPESERSATHKRFRLNPPKNSIFVEMNYRDNPWFPDVLNEERLEDLEKRPDQYNHVWEGGFKTIYEGAYYAKALSLARMQGRVGRIAVDPLMPIKAYWDIGVGDATSIWIVQFIGREIRVVDHYEAEGQPLAAHLNWLRSNGYENAECVLPHDGSHRNAVTGSKFQDHVRDAGFKVRVIENQGAGAAMMRIEAGRRLFPRCWFDEDHCASGLVSLGNYHEKRDEKRNIGLGPSHDEFSHAADAFGLMCIDYKEPRAPGFVGGGDVCDDAYDVLAGY